MYICKRLCVKARWLSMAINIQHNNVSYVCKQVNHLLERIDSARQIGAIDKSVARVWIPMRYLNIKPPG